MYLVAKLAPYSSPIIGPHALTGLLNRSASSRVARVWTTGPCRLPGSGSAIVLARHTEPSITGWHTIETQTVCMVGRPASFTDKKDLGGIMSIAYETIHALVLLFLIIVIDPCSRIKFGNLLFVFDFVF